ncbi:MAG TPA: AEC family transporter [Candidatus Cybelea sp.]|nr:AEC family transporter [Candidatus Cybelea sp.]
MTTIVFALLPVFLLIAFGWLLQRYEFPGRTFWPAAERVTYYVLFPALLVKELAHANLAGLSPIPLFLALAFSMAVLSGALLALRPWLAASWLQISGATFTSIFQGALSFNAYVGLAASLALYGDRGIAIFALVLAIAIPLVNVLVIAVHARHGEGGPRRPMAQMALIVQNPLILACVAGIVLNLGDLDLPPGIGPALDILGKASVALGLLTVGAALDPQEAYGGGNLLGFIAILKLIVFPALMAAACLLLDVQNPVRTILVLWAALPIASSAYIMARQLGGDSTLLAAAITATTILAALTLPLVLSLVA